MADLRNEFSWSKSRDDMLRTCPRQYFYHYYGAWGGWDKRADPRTRTLYILKQLQTRQQWMGATVHNCIRWILETLRKSGRAPAEDLALKSMARRLQVDFQSSGEGLYWETPKDACALIEHEYDDIDVPDDAWQELFEKALRCVSTFYQSQVLRDLQALPADQWLDLEDLASFVLDGVKVWVQLDCAHRDGPGARIYDWKTGKAGAAGTRDQLALYTLYATGRWSLPPGDITAVEFNLASGELFEHRVEPGQFDTVKRRVAESAAAMRALLDDPAANRATEDRFALVESDKPCRLCSFRRVCPRWASSDA